MKDDVYILSRSLQNMGMLEWERNEKGWRYTTELRDKLGGMNAEIICSLREGSGMEALFFLKDSETKAQISSLKVLFEGEATEQKDGFVIVVSVKDSKGSGQLYYGPKLMTETERYHFERLARIENDNWEEMILLLSWMLLQWSPKVRGVQVGSQLMTLDSKEMKQIGKMVGASRMEWFFAEGIVNLPGEMWAEIILPHDKLYRDSKCRVWVSVYSLDGEEAYLEANVFRKGNQPLVVELDGFGLEPEEFPEFKLKTDEEENKRLSQLFGEIADAVVSEEEALSVDKNLMMNMEEMMIHLLDRYLRHHYGKVLFFRPGNEGSKRVALDWEKMSELMGEWMGF